MNDYLKATRIARRTVMSLEVRPASELSVEEQAKAGKSFLLLILTGIHDRQLSRAVLRRAYYEAAHPGKSKRTSAYAELLQEQLDCTRQLVESLTAVACRFIRRPDGQYVQMGNTAKRVQRLEVQVIRLAAQRGKLVRRVARESA